MQFWIVFGVHFAAEQTIVEVKKKYSFFSFISMFSARLCVGGTKVIEDNFSSFLKKNQPK